MEEPTPRPALACKRCRAQKIRCNRATPRCDRCIARDEECVYPTRAKTKRKRGASRLSGNPITDETLSAILDRLQLHLQGRSVSIASPVSQEKFSSLKGLLPESPCSFETSSFLSQDASTPEPFGTLSDLDSDFSAILKDAVDQVADLRTQTFNKSLVSEAINIPPDLAKTLIRDCFNHMQPGIFLNMINREVIETIPDIINLPYIHIEPVMVVLYYTLLYFGCALQTYDPHDKYLKLTYLGCLRALPAWQRKATGSTIDLIAALFLANVTSQLFDYDLAWKMAGLAGEFCKRLNLHNLDKENLGGINNARADDERRFFWELLQMDLMFRLVFDQPPLLTGSDWKVNLPWLNENSNLPSELPAITFLAGSRITFITLHFFKLLEEANGDASLDLISKTESLCREILQVFEHWQLNELLSTEHGPSNRLWSLGHVILTGYTAITFMLRKAASHASSLFGKKGIDLSDCPLIIDAARHIIQVATCLIDRHPNPHSLSALFGAYRCQIPYAYLANHIYQAPTIRQHVADIEALEHLATQMGILSRGLPDTVPLVRGIERINSELRQKLTDESSQDNLQELE